MAATQLHDQGILNELEIWKSLPATGRPHYLLPLRDHFRYEGSHGPHLCFVTDVLSINVSSYLRSLPDRALTSLVCKPILSLLASSVAGLHSVNIIHTGGSPCLHATSAPLTRCLTLRYQAYKYLISWRPRRLDHPGAPHTKTCGFLRRD